MQLTIYIDLKLTGMMKYIILVVLFFSEDSFAQSERTLRIDPSTISSVPASLVLEEVNYIPLETTRESLFGAVSQLLITDKYFIIRDRDTHCILLFLKNGKYHCKISRDVS